MVGKRLQRVGVVPAKMTSTDCTFGLSSFELCSQRKPYGPTLRFTFTWSVTLADGRIIAQSTPGFLGTRNKAGECKVRPPIRYSSADSSYAASLISPDCIDMIHAKLEELGWWPKIGKNRPTEALLELDPDDLTGNLPPNAVHF